MIRGSTNVSACATHKQRAVRTLETKSSHATTPHLAGRRASGVGTNSISIRLKSSCESYTAAADGAPTSEVKGTFELDMHFYFRTHLDTVEDEDEATAIASAVEQIAKNVAIEVSNV